MSQSSDNVLRQRSSRQNSEPNTAGKAAQNPASQYWWIHDKAYDLSPFLNSHPGGPDVLLMTKGRDVTEMFESVHSLSTRNIQDMMKQFEVTSLPATVRLPRKPGALTFTYNDDGVYAEIKRRVRKMFPTPESYKANTQWWALFILFLVVYSVSVHFGFVLGYLIPTVIAGTMSTMIGFYGALHDASHHALSTKWRVNKWLSVLSNNWLCWDYAIWWQHHCYAHHSFTGDPHQDPDLRNGSHLLRKHPHFKWRPFHRFQQYFMYVLYMLLPNQMIGQILEYWRGGIRHKVFGLELYDWNNRRSFSETAVTRITLTVSFLVHFIMPLYHLSFARAIFIIWLYWTAIGITYFLIVAPNHDTELVTFGSDDDWGEQQIKHSSNFSHSNPLLSSLFGGMNFQIEHHLFPTVCNIHLPRIAKVVKEVCAERGIKYNHYDSLWQAHCGVMRQYTNLGSSSQVKSS